MLKIPQIQEIKEDSFETIETAFSGAPAWVMHTLRNAPDPYPPGEVRLGWNRDSLVLLATLPDVDVRTEVTADQQPVWSLGDVFEIFVKRASQPGYHELHAAPNGYRMQLWFPSDKTLHALREVKDGWRKQLIDEPLFDFQTYMDPDQARWKVFVRLPWKTVAGASSERSDIWQLSCCRYDYREDLAEPVLESTSAHFSVLNFHHIPDWQYIRIERE